MSANDVVTEFIKAWSAGNPDNLAEYFTEDAVYHNIPMEPVTGRTAIRDFIASFLGMFDEVSFVIHRQLADGDVVLNERTDTFHRNGKTVDLPVMGTFELRDGKIAAWRDYFDMNQFTSQMG